MKTMYFTPEAKRARKTYLARLARQRAKNDKRPGRGIKINGISSYRGPSMSQIPPDVLQQWDLMSRVELQLNHVLLGDPPPGRSALDQRREVPRAPSEEEA